MVLVLAPLALLALLAMVNARRAPGEADLGGLEGEGVWSDWPDGAEPHAMMSGRVECAGAAEGPAARMVQTLRHRSEHAAVFDHYRNALIDDGWVITTPMERQTWDLDATKALDGRVATLEVAAQPPEPHGTGVVLTATIAPRSCQPRGWSSA